MIARSLPIRCDDPVTLVGGAPVSPALLSRARALAPRLVAADGGADRLLALGLSPEAVIGDMDSLTPAAREAFADRLFEVTEQETTDFDKALRHVEAPLALALGVTGGRLDHELAAMNALVLRPDRPCAILSESSLAFLCPPELTLDLPVGTGLGLFPMGPVRIASEGLLWPTDHLSFAPDGRIGTSNTVTGPVRLRPARAAMLVILGVETLEPAVRALCAPGPRWPAPAR